MLFEPTAIAEVPLIEPRVFADARGKQLRSVLREIEGV